MTGPASPRIVATVTVASAQDEPAVTARKIELYAAGIRRHGGIPVILDATATEPERLAAFAAMDGLLLTGGADIHPSRYGHADTGSHGVEPDRDALEAEAWAAAAIRGVPVLGICRGFQAINVFAGGSLLQHVDGHSGPRWGHGPAATHPIRFAADSVLGRSLTGGGGAIEAGDDPVLPVNTYHHQAVRAADLAPGLRATAWAESPAGELIEAFEATDGRFVVGVQCHPERTESTPPAFERLWAAFVEACRRSVVRPRPDPGVGPPSGWRSSPPTAGRRE